jgi:hypothetical protein
VKDFCKIVAAMVFPELCVTGYTCGDVFFREDALSAAESALSALMRETAALSVVSVVGFPERDGNAIFNAAAVTYREYYEARQFTPAPDTEPTKVFDSRASGSAAPTRWHAPAWASRARTPFSAATP